MTQLQRSIFHVARLLNSKRISEMSFLSDNALPEDFTGIVRLFPLPNVVLFPGVIQGLHIFEPRYRKMTEDAIASDQLITMSLPEMTPDVDLQLSPPLREHVCIGKILTHNLLEDGRYNLLVMGVQRARLVEEIVGDLPYRTGRVELFKETCHATVEQVSRSRKLLVSMFLKHSKSVGNFDEDMIANLANPELPFGMFVDLICYSINPGVEFLQQVLRTTDVWQRCELLMKKMDLQPPGPETGKPKFPPGFSEN